MDHGEDEKLIDEKIIKYGSLMSLFFNKEFSVVSFVILLINDERIRNNFCRYMDMSYNEILIELGKRYDILGKSKKIEKNCKHEKTN